MLCFLRQLGTSHALPVCVKNTVHYPLVRCMSCAKQHLLLSSLYQGPFPIFLGHVCPLQQDTKCLPLWSVRIPHR